MSRGDDMDEEEALALIVQKRERMTELQKRSVDAKKKQINDVMCTVKDICDRAHNSISLNFGYIDKINKEDLYATDDTTYNILKRICWVPFINGIFSLGILVLDVLLLFATIVWFIYKKFKSLKIKFKINLPIKNKLISSYIIKCNELYKKIVKYIMKLKIA